MESVNNVGENDDGYESEQQRSLKRRWCESVKALVKTTMVMKAKTARMKTTISAKLLVEIEW